MSRSALAKVGHDTSHRSESNGKLLNSQLPSFSQTHASTRPPIQDLQPRHSLFLVLCPHIHKALVKTDKKRICIQVITENKPPHLLMQTDSACMPLYLLLPFHSNLLMFLGSAHITLQETSDAGSVFSQLPGVVSAVRVMSTWDKMSPKSCGYFPQNQRLIYRLGGERGAG